MSTQTPKPDGPGKQTAPGKPASRQPTDGAGKDQEQKKDRDEGQNLPKTGRAASDTVVQRWPTLESGTLLHSSA
jgi:hypothetical protein